MARRSDEERERRFITASVFIRRVKGSVATQFQDKVLVPTVGRGTRWALLVIWRNDTLEDDVSSWLIIVQPIVSSECVCLILTMLHA